MHSARDERCICWPESAHRRINTDSGIEEKREDVKHGVEKRGSLRRRSNKRCGNALLRLHSVLPLRRKSSHILLRIPFVLCLGIYHLLPRCSYCVGEPPRERISSRSSPDLIDQWEKLRIEGMRAAEEAARQRLADDEARGIRAILPKHMRKPPYMGSSVLGEAVQRGGRQQLDTSVGVGGLEDGDHVDHGDDDGDGMGDDDSTFVETRKGADAALQANDDAFNTAFPCCCFPCWCPANVCPSQFCGDFA